MSDDNIKQTRIQGLRNIIRKFPAKALYVPIFQQTLIQVQQMEGQ